MVTKNQPSPNQKLTDYYNELIKTDINKFFELVDSHQIDFNCLTKKQQKIINGRRKKHYYKDNKNTFKTLWMFCRQYKQLLIWALVFALINVVLNAVSTFGMQQLTELISYSQVSHTSEHAATWYTINWTNFKILCAYAGVLTLFCVVMSGALWIQTKLLIKVSQGIGYRIRKALFKKISNLPAKYFDTHTSGDIISSFTNDVNNITNGLSQNAGIVLSGLLTSFSMLISMFLMSSYLALITLGLLPLLIIPILYMTKKSQPLFKKTQESLGKMNSFIEETIFNQDIISTYSLENKTINEFKDINNKLSHSAQHSQAISSLMFPYTNFFINVLNCIITVIGLLFVIKGIPFAGIDMPSIIGVKETVEQTSHINQALFNQYMGGIAVVAAFSLMAGGFMAPFAQVGNVMNMLQMIIAGATHSFKLLNTEDDLNHMERFVLSMTSTYNNNSSSSSAAVSGLTEVWSHSHETHEEEKKVDTEQEKSFESVVTNTQIEFKDVSLTNKDDVKLLDNCNFTIAPNETVVIYDKSGFSKRSIADLLVKIYNLDNGEILLGNNKIPLLEVERGSLRENIIIAYQDGFLTNGTIKENLMLLNKSISFDEVIAISKKLKLHDWVMTLENGYDTVIEDNGEQFSLGQKQLLSICRCLLTHAKVLIFDESLSQLDPRSQIRVRRVINEINENKTVIYLTHKIHDTLNSHSIMVMKDGKIIETGSYNDLISRDSYYKKCLEE
ncbi:ABC transporter ATP-binding protein [Ureaplasma ceti]|uniref:ABC transporter ATP-binding protein n=1 Tax=Ureaplasma ceti TaxID=3119530 RepID=A0ABP9U8D9_9BACT